MRAGLCRATFLAPVLVSLALAGGVSARTGSESPFSKAQTYSGALRYLRVNLGYEVTERDPDAAYLLFRYVPPGKHEPSAGSIEVVETEERVMLLVDLPALPSYHETVLRDGLLAKLRAEYGEPPRKKPRTDERDPKPPKKDESAGTDDESGASKKDAASARRSRDSARRGSPAGAGR